MNFFTGTKRKSDFPSMENPDSLLFEHSRTKRSCRSHALRCIANGQCLPDGWNVDVMDIDQTAENTMEAVVISPHDSTKILHHSRNFSAPAHSNSPSPQFRPQITISNTSLAIEDVSTQDLEPTQHTLFNQCCKQDPDANSEKCLLLQSRPAEIDEPILLPVASRTAQRCPECAAGRSGHIRHIGRWRLMDSQ